MDSTANTCSPMADSSISGCLAVSQSASPPPPSFERMLSGYDSAPPPHCGLSSAFSTEPWIRRGRSCPPVPGLSSPSAAADQTLTLQNLRHICTPRSETTRASPSPRAPRATSRRRRRVRGERAPPAASSSSLSSYVRRVTMKSPPIVGKLRPGAHIRPIKVFFSGLSHL